MSATVLCLALAIYHEARGESVLGQKAVAEVVINRAKEKEKTTCEVISEKNQFSWYHRKGKVFPVNDKSWNHSIEIAQESLTSPTDYTRGATFFNTKNIGVRYGLPCKLKVGNHVFY